MKLSKREIQVLKMISSELNDREIASLLFISNNTVSTHRKNIKNKLGVTNSAGLIREAFQRGYLQVGANY